MLEEVLAMLCKFVRPLTSNPAYPVILVPEAINPEGAISYAMQNRSPTYQYPVIMVPDTKTVRKSWRTILSAPGSMGRKWACEKPLYMSVSEHSYFEVAGT